MPKTLSKELNWNLLETFERLLWRYKGNTYGIYRNDDWPHTYNYVKLVPRNKVCGCVLVVREGT